MRHQPNDRKSDNPFRDNLENSARLPTHIETAASAIARLHAEHEERATAFQRFTEGLTAKVGRQNFVGWLTVVVVGWIAINVVFMMKGRNPFDSPPFAWLELVASLVALYMTALILSTQRRDDELPAQRERLTLELAILSDQTSAKIIELLEELRRDHPDLQDRVDQVARVMSTPTDPQEVLDAIEVFQEKTRSEQRTHRKVCRPGLLITNSRHRERSPATALSLLPFQSEGIQRLILLFEKDAGKAAFLLKIVASRTTESLSCQCPYRPALS